MVLNIKELNLDKDKKYVVFFDGNIPNKEDVCWDMRLVTQEFERIGVDNNNIFYFPWPIIIQEK